MNGNRISYYQRNFIDCQRCPDIEPDWIYAIWYSDKSGWSCQYHIASFKTEKQLKKFARRIGFKYEWTEERDNGYKEGRISVDFEDESHDQEVEKEWRENYNKAFHSDDLSEKETVLEWLHNHFKDKRHAYGICSENLKRAKKIKALSNGSIVDCLFVNDGKRVKFYRCNPNAKDFYKPLSLEKHIKFQQTNGVY